MMMIRRKKSIKKGKHKKSEASPLAGPNSSQTDFPVPSNFIHLQIWELPRTLRHSTAREKTESKSERIDDASLKQARL